MTITPLGRDGRILLSTALVLVVFGVLAVYSASSFASMRVFGNSYHYVVGHLLRILVGTVAGIIVYIAGPRAWKAMAWLLYALSILALLPTVLGGSSIAPVVNGSSRWLVISGVRFMPSEFARFSYILLVATLISRGHISAREPRGFVAIVALALVPAAFTIAQPDYAGSFYMLAVMSGMLYLAEARFSHILILFAAIAVLGAGALMMESYRIERIQSWINPEAGMTDNNFQTQQSCIALGSGGLLGRGLGHGRQQRGFLPEVFSDFILAVIGEETGLLGTSLVLAAFCVLLWTGFRIAERADGFFGSVLAGGLTASIALGSFIHIAVVTRLLPATGITLPLISWGGTSIVFTIVSLAMAARISAEERR
ncbi:MAG TPA: FtsW/RodA/SpoVE family cell cycle protein [Candidatus Fermentibacter daniensis]|nr:FtsW/RodA/SpoVE family cell cycle protein [Candidatus Fermentibacter sp.]HOD19998.1 FtsW/RodA/SpoVE family cell cycle protein [Candidatus Fermentibacter daniensis]HOF67655.1 FtsW/RodA/SpoVE family cell cycle protein [Candidatus Fermentibacter daniensis]HOR08285.1 FtsW/RodA/SpoVE family cell cycle protein [Candidatus Fermentibacter daniensis]HPK52609.1 FtsW/RodA/SpoVE family cell cycle protein [Candidatus Fermentibacter daniensis]